jgi:NADH-quinone oxidoreductase subunit F
MRSAVLPGAPLLDVEQYLRRGGGAGLRRARSLGPGGVIAELLRARLRGRGGAGFPTGRKWRAVRDAPGATRYVVCNAAEGEPGTFKDRAILRADPYQVIEGLAIAACALEAPEAFIAIKASFAAEREALIRAAVGLEDAGLLGDLTVTIVNGPEEYLFGEEKALLEVIEGRDPLPRVLPPYVHGLFATAPQLGWHSHEPERGHPMGEESNPTLVNNVETLAHVAHIIARGADWFREVGTPASPGTTVVTLVGDVRTPGVVEVDLGTPLRWVLDHCGGTSSGRAVKAVFSGVTNAVLPGHRLDVALSHEAMTAAGSGLGAAGFIVYDDSTCMAEVAEIFSRFLWVESCGQCPACKLGTGRITEALGRLAAFRGGQSDVAEIHHRLRVVSDGNRCFLPLEEQQVVGSLLRTFPGDFVAHLEGRRHRHRDLVLPKIVDLDERGVVYDDRQRVKRPDWTYAA